MGISGALGAGLDKEFFKHFIDNEGLAALAAMQAKKER